MAFLTTDAYFLPYAHPFICLTYGYYLCEFNPPNLEKRVGLGHESANICKIAGYWLASLIMHRSEVSCR